MQRYSVVLAKFRENGHNSMVLMVLLGYLLYFGENVIHFIVYIPNNICLMFCYFSAYATETAIWTTNRLMYHK